ncbi:O-acetyl-ADP-ribose deacetylase macrod1, partial [Rhizophlyctis rosea]
EKENAKEKDEANEKKTTLAEQEEDSEGDDEDVGGKVQNWSSSQPSASSNTVSVRHANDDERKEERNGTRLPQSRDAPKPPIVREESAGVRDEDHGDAEEAGVVDDDDFMELDLEEEEVLEPMDVDESPGTVDEEEDGEDTKLEEVFGEVKMVAKQTPEPSIPSADDQDGEMVGGDRNEDAPPAQSVMVPLKPQRVTSNDPASEDDDGNGDKKIMDAGLVMRKSVPKSSAIVPEDSGNRGEARNEKEDKQTLEKIKTMNDSHSTRAQSEGVAENEDSPTTEDTAEEGEASEGKEDVDDMNGEARVESSAKKEVTWITVESLPSLTDFYDSMDQEEFDEDELAKSPNGIFNDKIVIWKGNIASLVIDAIVNAAKQSLLGGGGVDGVIHAAAGCELLQECRTLGGCDTGDAKITKGYNLPAHHVIHTVGPIGEDSNKLSSCYMRSLDVLVENGLRTIAFCCISTGIYGYPNGRAADVALRSVRMWLEDGDNADKVDSIVFCLLKDVDVSYYCELATLIFPPVEKTERPKSSTPDDDGESQSASKKEDEAIENAEFLSSQQEKKSDQASQDDPKDEDGGAGIGEVTGHESDDGEGVATDMEVDEPVG